MKMAIEVVFPGSRHKSCLRHIIKKSPEKLSRYNQYQAKKIPKNLSHYSQYQTIKADMRDVVYDALTEDEFDKLEIKCYTL